MTANAVTHSLLRPVGPAGWLEWSWGWASLLALPAFARGGRARRTQSCTLFRPIYPQTKWTGGRGKGGNAGDLSILGAPFNKACRTGSDGRSRRGARRRSATKKGLIIAWFLERRKKGSSRRHRFHNYRSIPPTSALALPTSCAPSPDRKAQARARRRHHATTRSKCANVVWFLEGRRAGSSRAHRLHDYRKYPADQLRKRCGVASLDYLERASH